MYLAIFLVVAGVLTLYLGAEALIRGACGLAARLGISSLIIGITVVALGTSLPEVITSVVAHVQWDASDVALGNIVGSNIANIGLVVGLSALVRPLDISRAVRQREVPILLVVTIAFCLVMIRGEIGRIEGVLFFIAMLAFVVYQIYLARLDILGKEDIASLPDLPSLTAHHIWSEVVLCVVGMGALLFGGHLLVSGSVWLAEAAGISQRVIGLTIVALGTSSPEVAASLVASLRKESDVSVGNVVGSNLFNILFTIGLSAALIPLPVSPTILSIDGLVMLGFTLFLAALAYAVHRIGRLAGAFLLLAYCVYLTSLIIAG